MRRVGLDRFRRGLAVVVPGEGQEGLAGDLKVADLLAGLLEPGGQLVDAGLNVGGLAGQGLLAGLDPVQAGNCLAPGPRSCGLARQEGTEAPVSRRAITSVIAQYTRDPELDSLCS